jgi:hypothetical protein
MMPAARRRQVLVAGVLVVVVVHRRDVDGLRAQDIDVGHFRLRVEAMVVLR